MQKPSSVAKITLKHSTQKVDTMRHTRVLTVNTQLHKTVITHVLNSTLRDHSDLGAQTVRYKVYSTTYAQIAT